MGCSSNSTRDKNIKRYGEKKDLEGNGNKIGIIKEAYIPGHAEALSMGQIDKIKEQMKKSICKIDDKMKGTGFLCLIPNPNIDHLLKVLITCNHVLSDLTIGNKLKLIFENSKEKTIILDESRRLYTNFEYDVTIIELKDNEFDLNNFLKIDDDLYKEEEFSEIYRNKSIYIIHYPKGKEVKYSVDVLSKIDKNDYIFHCCTTEGGSSGAPILNLLNFQVIGIHNGWNKESNHNIGKLIKFPIDDFNKKIAHLNKENSNPQEKLNNNEKLNDSSKNNNPKDEEKKEKTIKSEILLELKIVKEDVNKRVYFFHNPSSDSNDYNNHILKELNEANAVLFINKKEYKYSNYFTPDKEGIYKIFLKIDIPMKTYSCSYLFYECKRIIKIRIFNLITSNITNIRNMFAECSLTNLSDISKWDISNVTDMSYLFYNCDLQIIGDISKWNTSHVTDMSHMFEHCKFIQMPDISKWDTSNVTNLSNIFAYSEFSKLPDISKWNTCKVTDMSNLYAHSYLSKVPNISIWNTSNVTNMSHMFSCLYSCKALPDISKMDTSNVIDMSSMFSENYFSKLPDISNWDTSNVIDMGNMFYECTKISTLPDISNWDTSKVKNMGGMFCGCSELSTLPEISNWDTNNVTDMSFMFSGLLKLSTLPDISNWNTSNVTDMSHMFGCYTYFYYFGNEEKYHINNKNVNSNIVNLPDISKWDTKNVDDMSHIFCGCSKLSDLPDISKWNTSKVTNMSYMFYKCSKLSTIPDISKWDTNNITNISHMFDRCSNKIVIPNKFKN